VLFQYPDMSGLLGKLGVAVEQIKSGPLKAEPSGFNPTTPEARAALQSVVNDTFGWFKGLVGDRRGLSGDGLNAVSDGPGVQRPAGPSAQARRPAWLRARRDRLARAGEGRSSRTSRADWKPRDTSRFSLWSAAAFGATSQASTRSQPRIRSAALDTVKLDGLLAVWQPRTADQ
jgi:protease-4